MARSATPGRKLVPQRARRQEQALARARDHLIRRRQMLELVVDDWHHALGDRLVLQVDAVDLRVDLVTLLSRRSKPQSLHSLCSMRRRPSQSVVLGRILLPQLVPPIGVPSLRAGWDSDMADTARFHQMKMNIVWWSSNSTQARASTTGGGSAGAEPTAAPCVSAGGPSLRSRRDPAG